MLARDSDSPPIAFSLGNGSVNIRALWPKMGDISLLATVYNAIQIPVTSTEMNSV